VLFVSKSGTMKRKLNTTKATPFLKWVGGKTQLLPELRKFYPKSYGTYFEPFVGGGAVFFDLKPKKSVLNDINKTLIRCYEDVKKRPEQVIKTLHDLEIKYKNENDDGRKDLYYEIRAKFNQLPSDSFEKGILLMFLNKTCFNGMYRENSEGGFNVPFGSYKNPTLLDESNVRAASQLLRGASLLSVDFNQAVAKAKKGDFIYFDPPYYPLNHTSKFTHYNGNGFHEHEQKKLRDLFADLNKKGCKVMLSNSFTPFIKNLYKDFYKHEVWASRAINCKATGRGKIREYVIVNYKI